MVQTFFRFRYFIRHLAVVLYRYFKLDIFVVQFFKFIIYLVKKARISIDSYLNNNNYTNSLPFQLGFLQYSPCQYTLFALVQYTNSSIKTPYSHVQYKNSVLFSKLRTFLKIPYFLKTPDFFKNSVLFKIPCFFKNSVFFQKFPVFQNSVLF